MSEYFTLHDVLKNKSDSQCQILRENLLFYINHARKQEFIYSFAKKECLFLNDEVCLYLKRSFNDQSSPLLSLNYPCVKHVVKTNRKSQLYHSQSIRLDSITQAIVSQQTILTLTMANLKDITFIFKSSQLANQWAYLIKQKINENRIFRKKKDEDQIKQSSFNYTIDNFVSQIYQKDQELSQLNNIMIHQNEIIKALKKRINNISQKFSCRNNFRSFVRIDNNNDETFLESEKEQDGQSSKIIAYLFQQIIQRNQLISHSNCSIEIDNNNIKTTQSKFITNKQDLIQNMAIKIAKILQKSTEQTHKILMRRSQ